MTVFLDLRDSLRAPVKLWDSLFELLVNNYGFDNVGGFQLFGFCSDINN